MKKLLIFFLCFFAVQSLKAQGGILSQGMNAINKKKQEQELKVKQAADDLKKAEQERELKEKQAADNLKKTEAEAKEKQAKVENRRKIESSFPHLIDSTSSSYVKGNPFANQFHKDNVGKILFSTKVTTNPEKLTAKSFTDTILFGQEIDVRYFLPTSIRNYLVYDSVNVTLDENTHRMGEGSPNSCNYVVIVTINGERIERGDRLVKMDEKKLTTFSDPIYSYVDKKNTEFYREYLNKLPVGTSKVSVELWGGSRYPNDGNRTMKPICTGEFTMIRKTNKPLAYLKKFSEYQPKRKDPVIEAAAMKAMTLAMKEEGKTENYTKAVIMKEDWTISRDEYTGAILSRQLPVVGFFKKEDGTCHTQQFIIFQTYVGGGNYSTSVSAQYPGGVIDIDCD
jgi:hypothetical protein